MKRPRQKKVRPEEMLGILAAKFRGTRDEAKRDAIAEDYSRAVTQLIKSGKWRRIPPLEDQLPDERLPEAFFQHWDIH
jgi:hypothetical protein